MPSKKKSTATEAASAEPPAGWTRYFDPGTAQTYLYCDETGEWFFEAPAAATPAAPAAPAEPEPDRNPIDAPELLMFGVSTARPSAPPVPAAPTAPIAPTVSGSGDAGRDAVQDLAKVDPIVQDLLRDELKLKKKLREIEALEVASQEKQLEATQLIKLSKKEAILSDLQLVQVHIAEALEEFKSRWPNGASEVRRTAPAPKTKAKQSQPVQPGVNPLPQRGKAPMPVNPRIADMKLGNSASRHPTLAGYAGSVAQGSSAEGPTQSSGISGTQRTAKSASASSGPNTQSPQVPFVPRQNLGVAIPAVDEDGFVAVRKGAKPKKKSSTGNVSSAPVAPEDDEFW
mmetsp:Transcript_77597/g.122396  ORF Transcript_77597/g.122396 Transcript_77597/m.122396 type:complete len:343 (+) Transcript_77597:83-1111(+)